ncbi:hypothetical protein L6R53_30525 [Myxococcota bacterium]|nr:hypothetical protein [Myxococcota bacterium]
MAVGPLRALLFRLSWFAALATLVTWPMALDPVGSLLGHPQASAPCHVWVLWWARHHLDALHSPLLFHPYGADVVTLYGSDVLSPLLLRWLPLPPTLLYNAWVWALLVLGGLGADRLARDRGASAGGGLLAGTILATAPFFQHEILNGTSEILAASLLPWVILALFRVLERPVAASGASGADRGAWAWGLALGVGVGIAVAASAYNLFFVLLAASVVTLAALTSRAEPVLHRGTLQGIAASVVGVAPFGLGLAALQATHGASAVYSRRESWTSPELALPDAFASLEMWLDRSEAVIPALQHLPGGETFEYWTTCTVYLGLVAVAAALVGLVRGWRSRPVGTFAALALVAALVASGPYLRWQGAPVELGGTVLPMPGLMVARLLPPFVITAVHSYRYAGLVVLGVAVLAAMSVRRLPLGILLSLLVVGDAVLASPVPWPAARTPMPSSPALSALAQAPEGAVLHAPVEAEHLGDLGAAMLAQVVHGKPMQDGGIHRRAGQEATALFTQVPLVADLARRPAPVLPGQKTTRWSLARLHEAGFRYVLVGADEEGREVQGWLAGVLGPPTAEDPQWAWWTLPPPEALEP